MSSLTIGRMPMDETRIQSGGRCDQISFWCTLSSHSTCSHQNEIRRKRVSDETTFSFTQTLNTDFAMHEIERDFALRRQGGCFKVNITMKHVLI